MTQHFPFNMINTGVEFCLEGRVWMLDEIVWVIKLDLLNKFGNLELILLNVKRFLYLSYLNKDSINLIAKPKQNYLLNLI